MKKFTRLKHPMAMDFTSEDCQPGHHPLITLSLIALPPCKFPFFWKTNTHSWEWKNPPGREANEKISAVSKWAAPERARWPMGKDPIFTAKPLCLNESSKWVASQVGSARTGAMADWEKIQFVSRNLCVPMNHSSKIRNRLGLLWKVTTLYHQTHLTWELMRDQCCREQMGSARKGAMAEIVIRKNPSNF